jgi:hypothetical protein
VLQRDQNLRGRDGHHGPHGRFNLPPLARSD